jgi:hypothetical protein
MIEISIKSKPAKALGWSKAWDWQISVDGNPLDPKQFAAKPGEEFQHVRDAAQAAVDAYESYSTSALAVAHKNGDA